MFFDQAMRSDAALASSLPAESGLLTTPRSRLTLLNFFFESLLGVTLETTFASFRSAPVVPATAMPAVATTTANPPATIIRDFLINFSS